MFLSELRQDGHTVCKTPAPIIILKLLFRDRTVRALRGEGQCTLAPTGEYDEMICGAATMRAAAIITAAAC